MADGHTHPSTNTTGSERADALLTAKLRANAAFYAGVPEAPLSRHARRRSALVAAKHEGRPGPNKTPLTSRPGKPDRANNHHLWAVMQGRTEVYLHATKGIRTRYLGEG